MSFRTIVLAGFAVLCVVQAALPIGFIARHERALRDGQVFRFEAVPVDPVDFFRGRYLALALEQERAVIPVAGSWDEGDRVFVRFETGDDGFARIASILRERPADTGRVSVEARVERVASDGLLVDLPFDRYYVEEGAATELESLYRESARSGEGQAWITVRVREGRGTIEELFLDGRPVGKAR